MGVGFVGVALASSAWAQENAKTEGTNVTTNVTSMKVGGEFAGGLLYNDNGLYKSTGVTPDKATTLGLDTANIKLTGNLNADTEYAFRFNLLNPNPTPLDYGYGTHWFSKMFGFSVGKMKVLQGGWDNLDSGYIEETHGTVGIYAANLPIAQYTPMIAVHANLAGRISLQIFNDNTPTSMTQASYNKTKHPSFALGWLGDFGPIKPEVDLGTYDNQKSRWYDVSVKTNMAGLIASLGYWRNDRAWQGTNSSGKAVDNTDSASAISLTAGYEVKNVVTPWVYFSTYDNKQDGTNAKGNTMASMPAQSGTCAAGMAQVGASCNAASWTDNGMIWGIGADLLTFGNNWTPFISYISTSGKFLKNANDVAGATETRTDNTVKLGVHAEI